MEITGPQGQEVADWREAIKDPDNPDIVFVPLGEPKSILEQLAEVKAELAMLSEQLPTGLKKVDIWGEGVDETLASIAGGCLHGFANRAYCVEPARLRIASGRRCSRRSRT